jgi:hypothetical protein
MIISIIIGIIISLFVYSNYLNFKYDDTEMTTLIKGDKLVKLEKSILNNNTITKKDILKYKCYKNSNYLDNLFILGVGLGYFGLYKYWNHNQTQHTSTPSADQLVDMVEEKMPWIIEHQNNSTINDYNINTNYLPNSIPIQNTFLTDSKHDIVNIINNNMTNIHDYNDPANLYTQPVPWSEKYRNDPDFWVNDFTQDTPMRLPDGSIIGEDNSDFYPDTSDNLNLDNDITPNQDIIQIDGIQL